jgi:transposase-like protein
MRSQRSFILEFKRQVIEELLSGESGPAQLCRRYNITSSLLYHWKKQYSRGKFNNEPTEERALAVCNQCHNKQWVGNFFLSADSTVYLLQHIRDMAFDAGDELKKLGVFNPLDIKTIRDIGEAPRLGTEKASVFLEWMEEYEEALKRINGHSKHPRPQSEHSDYLRASPQYPICDTPPPRGH